MIFKLPATQVRKIPLYYSLGIFISLVIYKITTALSEIAKYIPIPSYGESKEKAFYSRSRSLNISGRKYL